MVVALVIFLFFASRNGRDVAVEVTTPDTVLSGVPFDMRVNISNNSNVILKDTQIIVNLPAEFVFVGSKREVFKKQVIGDVEPGKILSEVFKIIPMSQPNTIKQLATAVSYQPGSFSSRFEKDIGREVVVGEPGAVLDIIPPTKVFGSEEFETQVTYHNNSNSDLRNAQLRIFYANGFTFSSADPAPLSTSNSMWNLGDIAVGEGGTILLKGSIVGQAGAAFEFKLDLSADVGDGVYSIAQKSGTVSLASSPLSLAIVVNDNPGLIASPGDQLTYKLVYANNTEVALQDVIIKAKLEGEMFDLKKLKSDGALGGDNTVMWNAARVPGLRILPAGGRGVVEFTVPAKEAYPITRLSSKNFTLKVKAQIQSPTVPRGIASNQTIGVASSEHKVRGKLGINASVFYRDAASGIANAGMVPPRVGQRTQYTIHWKLLNFSTDLDGVTARAFLGPNVRYTGQSKVNASSSLIYNERNQEMVWNVGTVPATRGILSPAYEAIFQVELTPSIDQIDDAPELIQDTTVEYHDLFTDESLRAAAGRATTRVPDDLTVIDGEKTVKP